jgi:hypothetical protein
MICHGYILKVVFMQLLFEQQPVYSLQLKYPAPNPPHLSIFLEPPPQPLGVNREALDAIPNFSFSFL